MIRFLILTFALTLWGLLAGSDDAAVRLCLMGGAFCSGSMLLGTLVERTVRA